MVRNSALQHSSSRGNPPRLPKTLHDRNVKRKPKHTNTKVRQFCWNFLVTASKTHMEHNLELAISSPKDQMEEVFSVVVVRALGLAIHSQCKTIEWNYKTFSTSNQDWKSQHFFERLHWRGAHTNCSCCKWHCYVCHCCPGPNCGKSFLNWRGETQIT